MRGWTTGPGTGDRDRLATVLLGDPAGTLGPVLRVQRSHPSLVEVVNDRAHMRLVSHPHHRDLRHRVADVGRQQDRRPLARREVLSRLSPTLQRDRLLMRKRSDEHFRGTHRHLQGRDASPFAVDRQIPVKPSEKTP